MVEKIEVANGICAAKTIGHVIEIPGFGSVTLGELIVDYNSFNLNMLRVTQDASSAATTASKPKPTGGGPHGGANGTNTGRL